MERKKINNIIEHLFFLVIPLVIFFTITINNKNKIENSVSQSQINNNPRDESTENELINLGIKYINQKKYQKSIEINLQVLVLNSNNKLAHNNLGYAYAKLKQWDKGIKHCSKAIQLDSNFQLAKNNLQLIKTMMSKSNPEY